MKKSKRMVAFVLSALLAGSVAVPAYAANEYKYSLNSSYGMEYDETVGMVDFVRKTDAHGQTIYVRGNVLNNKVFPLSEAPKMEHTKTIGDITFSNYIKHNEKTLNGRDDNSNRAKLDVTQVYVGIGASMRSEVDNVEFMLSWSGGFNAMNNEVLPRHIPTSDLAQVKTNTPAYTAFNGMPFYEYVDYFSVRPYTNDGRNNDGTWKKGLTWVFEEHTKEIGTTGGAGWGYLGDPNKYMKIYSIRVESPNGTEYYQVIVTNDTNYADQKAPAATKPATTPVVTKPAATATANPTSSKVYVDGKAIAFDAYNINGNNYFKLRDVAYAINGTEKQFAVGWDSVNRAISLTSGSPYVGEGGTVSGSKQKKTASSTDSPIYVNSQKTAFTAYQIDGNNFFKLRDLGQTFNFYVGWDNATQSITIDTTKDYQ